MAGQSRSRPFSRKISKQPGGEPAGATSRRPAIAAPRTVGAGPPARKWGQWARWPVLAGSPGRERGPDKRLAIFLSRTVGRQGREVGSATGRAHIPHQARYSPRVSRRLAALQQASSRGCALPVLTVPPGLRAAARPRSGFCRVTKSCGCCIGVFVVSFKNVEQGLDRPATADIFRLHRALTEPPGGRPSKLAPYYTPFTARRTASRSAQ